MQHGTTRISQPPQSRFRTVIHCTFPLLFLSWRLCTRLSTKQLKPPSSHPVHSPASNLHGILHLSQLLHNLHSLRLPRGLLYNRIIQSHEHIMFFLVANGEFPLRLLVGLEE